MNIPDPVNRINGMTQAADGYGQGGVGSFVGQATGANTGINRAATGGASMDSGARQKQGVFSFLGSVLSTVAPVANLIPGVGPLVGAGASALGGLIGGIGAQQGLNKANAANQTALGNEAGIANSMLQGPQLGPLIKAEQSGLSSAVDNANTANPGKTLLDGLGQAFTNAIAGVTQGRENAQNSAAGIYQNLSGAATNAASSIGNPWTGSANAVQSGVDALQKNAPEPRTPVNPSTPSGATSSGASGTFDVSGGIKNTFAPGFGGGPLPPANIGKGWGNGTENASTGLSTVKAKDATKKAL